MSSLLGAFDYPSQAAQARCINYSMFWSFFAQYERFQPGKRAHLLDFPLFLGIFQRDEPKKRVPFTNEPEIPEVLTKWRATLERVILNERPPALAEPAFL